MNSNKVAATPFDFPSRLPHRGRADITTSRRKHIAAISDDPELFRAQLSPEDFSFAGERFVARVVSVYDGDTVRIAFRLAAAEGSPLVQWPARLLGYDAPEMHPRLAASTHDAEAAAAQRARAALVEAIGQSGIVVIDAHEFDKYGRILVDMRRLDAGPASPTVSSVMIAGGHGRPYTGGKKEEFGAV